MKTERPPAVVIHETPSIEMLAKPRKRKLFGHRIIDYEIRPRGYEKVDKRKTVPHNHGMGRPYFKAMLGIFDDGALYTQFCKILNGLVYCEKMALARALGVHKNTIYNWTKGKASPKVEILVLVAEWDKAGKPLEKVRPGIDDGRSVICPNMADQLAGYILPARQHPNTSMFFSDQVTTLKAIKEFKERGRSPLVDLLRKEKTYSPFNEVPPNPWDDDGEDDGKSYLNPWDRPPDFDSPFP